MPLKLLQEGAPKLRSGNPGNSRKCTSAQITYKQVEYHCTLYGCLRYDSELTYRFSQHLQTRLDMTPTRGNAFVNLMLHSHSGVAVTAAGLVFVCS